MTDFLKRYRLGKAAKRLNDPEWIKARIEFEVARRQATDRCSDNGHEKEQQKPHEQPFYD